MTLREFEAECLQLLAGIAESDAKACTAPSLTGELFFLRTKTICIKYKVSAWSGSENWVVWVGDPSKSLAGSGPTLHDAHLAFQDSIQDFYARHLRQVEPLLQSSSALLKNALRMRAKAALDEAKRELREKKDGADA